MLWQRLQKALALVCLTHFHWMLMWVFCDAITHLALVCLSHFHWNLVWGFCYSISTSCFICLLYHYMHCMVKITRHYPQMGKPVYLLSLSVIQDCLWTFSFSFSLVIDSSLYGNSPGFTQASHVRSEKLSPFVEIECPCLTMVRSGGTENTCFKLTYMLIGNFLCWSRLTIVKYS